MDGNLLLVSRADSTRISALGLASTLTDVRRQEAFDIDDRTRDFL
jgi:hypothetical protein